MVFSTFLEIILASVVPDIIVFVNDLNHECCLKSWLTQLIKYKHVSSVLN